MMTGRSSISKNLTKRLLVSSNLKSFAHDSRGVAAIVFVILAIPLILVIALGLEYAQSKTYQEKLQTIADNASLAAIRGNPNISPQQRQDAAIASIKGGLATLDKNKTVTVTKLAIVPVNLDIEVTVGIQSPYKMSFGSLVNMDKMTIKVSSTRKTNRAMEEQIRHDCHIGSLETLKKYDCSSQY